ncbi:MAG: mechanosensitive ion channel domain-containing protein [Blastocatellia bacterium]
MPKHVLFKAHLLLLALLVIGAWQRVGAQSPAPPGDDVSAGPEKATVVVWNRPIVVFRAYTGATNPQKRADVVAARITNLLDELDVAKIKAVLMQSSLGSGLVITDGSHYLFGIAEGDLDPATGETLEDAGNRAVTRLQDLLRAYADQQNLPMMLWAIAQTLGATLAFFLALWLIGRARNAAQTRLTRAQESSRSGVALFGVDLRPFLLDLGRRFAGLLALVLWLFSAYLWLTFTLKRFPYTRPWGEALRAMLLSIVGRLAAGVAAQLPNLLTLLIIVLVTRFCVKVVGSWFTAAERGAINVSWLDPETARVTRRLVIIGIWLFGLIVAYPYIPGAETDVFKGVSVFIGLVASLGSAGLVTQLMSGLVVVYSRALRVGDYIKVGELEGVVSEMGMLSTKIKTHKREVVTIPNAVLVGNSIQNFSRLAQDGGVVVHTSVTIGYDAPWRQVQALLLQAAAQTPGLSQVPKPFVLQTALSDFYVRYQLNAYLERPVERPEVLSRLHAEVQDAFNEYGVQIMSPSFESQPEQRVIIPKTKWFAPPAEAPKSGFSSDAARR